MGDFWGLRIEVVEAPARYTNHQLLHLLNHHLLHLLQMIGSSSGIAGSDGDGVDGDTSEGSGWKLGCLGIVVGSVVSGTGSVNGITVCLRSGFPISMLWSFRWLFHIDNELRYLHIPLLLITGFVIFNMSKRLGLSVPEAIIKSL